MTMGSGLRLVLACLIISALLGAGCKHQVEEAIGPEPDPIPHEEPKPPRSPLLTVIARDEAGLELRRGGGLLVGESLVVTALDLITGAAAVTIRVEHRDGSGLLTDLDLDTTRGVMSEQGLVSFVVDRPMAVGSRVPSVDPDLEFGGRLSIDAGGKHVEAVFAGVVDRSSQRWQMAAAPDVPPGSTVIGESGDIVGVVIGPVAHRPGWLWVAPASAISRLSRLNRPVSLPIPESNPPVDPVLSPVDKRIPVEARGIYLTGYTAGNPRRLRQMVDLVQRTELNAMVIDVKDSTGRLMYPSQVPLAVEMGAGTTRIADLAALADELRDHGIYLIARLVVFQDPWLGQHRPDLAIQHVSGGIWREPSGLSWVDPHSLEVWDYILDIAREVIAAGFHEIQFDYVRFPSDGNLRACVYPHADGRSKSEVIRDFLAYGWDELSILGAWTSADIYGLVPTALDDVGIGQQYEMVIEVVDYACPMAYPSHYAHGTYGLPNPDAAPYQTVLGTMKDAARRLGDGRAVIRPWLQDFTLGHRYGAAEVRAQIQAVYDTGFNEWLLWSPGNRYSEGALLPAVVPELEELR